MNNGFPYYDCAVIGGGLAGLAVAASLSKRGYRTILFEKGTYPFHKVCGEYLSLESKEYLMALGIPFEKWDLPLINTLTVSSPDGTAVTQRLPLGGLGVSRHRLDHALAILAKDNGAEVRDNAKVKDIKYHNDCFTIDSSKGKVNALICCGTFGKHSNIDVNWKRDPSQKKAGTNFIGVKYHALLDRPRHIIELHNFKNGYCGISPIEENKHCICYLTTESNLRSQANDIRRMEETILSGNPLLRKVWSEATFLFKNPLTISQISFAKKKQVENHVLMLGDAAGMLTPLCGNGMSMALHSAKIAAELITEYFEGKLNRAALEKMYQRQWESQFGKRIKAGRLIQYFFQKEPLANALVKTLKPFPGIINYIIKQTHGRQPF